MRKFKKTLSVMLAATMAFSAFSALPFTVSAAEVGASNAVGETGIFGDYEYQVLEDGTSEISRYNVYEHYVYDTEIIIPSEINGYKVTSIGEYAFAFCDRLTKVTIPNSVTNIGASAFSSCTSLADIEIPNSVTNIGIDAFFLCTSLADITIPNSLTTIGEFAFGCCENLKSIEIPDSVTSIDATAFWGCTSLKSVTIPYSVTTIGFHAFGYYLPDNPIYENGRPKNEKVNNFIINGYKNSAAETYANENGFEFVEIGKAVTGDVDGDGTLSVADATTIQKYLASIKELTPEQLALADFNGDGVVNVNDATAIQRVLVNS